MKNVVVISDLHCGHRAGLTPTGWQYPLNASDNERNKFATLQATIWQWLQDEIKTVGDIDVLIVNGDAIDGKGDRSGGTELIEGDMMKQCEIAAECIESFNSKKVYMTYGTPYHGGKSEDFEKLIAMRVGATYQDHPCDIISSHAFIDVNGLIFDVKHHVSGSIIPHGRHTGPARDALWNIVWHTRKNGQPLSDVFIRSHVHYHTFSGDSERLIVTTPALMGYGSKYGERRCSGVVDIGFVSFQVAEEKNYTWKSHILRAEFLEVAASVA